MLSIRARQLGALRAAAISRYVDQVMDRLRVDLPRQFAALTPEQARAKVVAGMDKAQRFGLATEQDVFRYVALAFLFGEDFTRRAWAAPVMQDSALVRPSERIAVLWENAPSATARP